jgi:hypothetical protein
MTASGLRREGPRQVGGRTDRRKGLHDAGQYPEDEGTVPRRLEPPRRDLRHDGGRGATGVIFDRGRESGAGAPGEDHDGAKSQTHKDLITFKPNAERPCAVVVLRYLDEPHRQRKVRIEAIGSHVPHKSLSLASRRLHAGRRSDSRQASSELRPRPTTGAWFWRRPYAFDTSSTVHLHSPSRPDRLRISICVPQVWHGAAFISSY